MNEDLKNQFVSHSIAVKLKYLGFNENCLCYYRDYHDVLFVSSSLSGEIDAQCGHENKDSSAYSAPTWMQAIEWLIKEKSLILSIKFDQDRNCYEYSLISTQAKSPYCLAGGFESYFDALKTGIEETLKYLKK
jgi:hypothetical protein